VKRIPPLEWEDFSPLGKVVLTIVRVAIVAGIIGFIYWLST
jgi:nitrate reductase NapE component